jgi:hypothetical protein
VAVFGNPLGNGNICFMMPKAVVRDGQGSKQSMTVLTFSFLTKNYRVFGLSFLR